MQGSWLVLWGMSVCLVPTITLRVLLSPIGNSQWFHGRKTLRLAFELARVIWIPQWGGGLTAAVGAAGILQQAGPGDLGSAAALLAGAALASGALLYGLHRLRAAGLFQEVNELRFAQGASHAMGSESLVLGLTAEGTAKAYPLRLLVYHHRLEDELSGRPVWVTYCGLCRSARVFRPLVRGLRLHFELLGGLRNNSIYRDRETGSWWLQATGEAIAGPLRGEELPQLPCDQMTLGDWLELHPETHVMLPDPTAAKGYEMFDFSEWDHTRQDLKKGPRFLWVVGVVHGREARAYPWSLLTHSHLIQDQLGDLPLAIYLRPNGFSFRVWDRRLDGRELDLRPTADGEGLVDTATGSRFAFDGLAVEGPLEGQRLRLVPSTLEYLHSFSAFIGGDLYGETAVRATWSAEERPTLAKGIQPTLSGSA